jgi:hypothetical protein
MTPHHVPPFVPFRCLHIIKAGYAVIEKTRETGQVSCMIVRQSPSSTNHNYPGSALAEFNSSAQAIELLDRWAADPLTPREIYPTEPTSNPYRGPRRSRPQADGQLTFNL